jgi:hypothetical protein
MACGHGFPVTVPATLPRAPARRPPHSPMSPTSDVQAEGATRDGRRASHPRGLGTRAPSTNTWAPAGRDTNWSTPGSEVAVASRSYSRGAGGGAGSTLTPVVRTESGLRGGAGSAGPTAEPRPARASAASVPEESATVGLVYVSGAGLLAHSVADRASSVDRAGGAGRTTGGARLLPQLQQCWFRDDGLFVLQRKIGGVGTKMVRTRIELWAARRQQWNSFPTDTRGTRSSVLKGAYLRDSASPQSIPVMRLVREVYAAPTLLREGVGGGDRAVP